MAYRRSSTSRRRVRAPSRRRTAVARRRSTGRGYSSYRSGASRRGGRGRTSSGARTLRIVVEQAAAVPTLRDAATGAFLTPEASRPKQSTF